MKDLISSKRLNFNEIDLIFWLADHYRKTRNSTFTFDNKCKILTTLFYEPSTRTSASFQSAMLSLGGSIIPINEVNYSSVSKGETLEDTIRTIGCYSDIIALRHPDEDSSERAVAVSSVPIINAGSGAGEHPTQALLDLYTIKQRFGKINGLTVTFFGDNKYSRTVASLYNLLLKYNVKVNWVGHPSMSPPKTVGEVDGVYEHLDKHLYNTDVIYVTRSQVERHPSSVGRDKTHFPLSFLDYAKEDMIIMHPFPRVNELSVEVDKDPRAWYFKQIQNGLYIRKAILTILLIGFEECYTNYSSTMKGFL